MSEDIETLADYEPERVRVQKLRGYPFPGVVVADFVTTTGERRVVVECTAPGVEGCLHIFAPEQLAVVP